MRVPIVPASLFSIVLGTAGLGTAWRAAEKLWSLPGAISEIIMAVAALVWAVLLVLYLLKWMAASPAAKAEIANPVQCCFVGLIGVATMLVAVGLLPYIYVVAAILFALGAAFTLGFGIWRTGFIWRGDRDPKSTTAVLYLPLVAGCFVLGNGLSQFGLPDWGQFAFGAGFFSWLAIESVLLQRLYTTEALAEALRPTLGIMLAPPAVGALTLINATGTNGDIIVHAMLGYAVLQAVILARMGLWISRRFVPSLWAFSFGATALASATIVLAARGDNGAIHALAPIAFATANILVLALAIGTLALLLTGKLLPKPTPLPAT